MITIRRIKIGEADLFKRLRLASMRDAPYAFSSAYELALRRSAASWREQADSTAQGADRATYVALSDGTPIGIAALYRIADQPDVGEVLQVWVDPEFRGKGVARDLMKAVFKWAGENRFRKVKATIRLRNAGALKFYRNFGFTPAEATSLESSDGMILVRDVGSK